MAQQRSDWDTWGLMRDDELAHYRDLYAARLANLASEIADDRPPMTPAELRATNPRLRAYLLTSGATRGVPAAELRASTAAFLRGLIADAQAEIDRRVRFAHVRTATAALPQFPKDWLADLKRRVHLGDIFEHEANLRLGRRSGQQQRSGPCPFCGGGEDSTRFRVYLADPDNERFHCFGCGQYGDALTAIAQLYGVGFREACTILATHAGLALPEAMRPKRPETPWSPDYVNMEPQG